MILKWTVTGRDILFDRSGLSFDCLPGKSSHSSEKMVPKAFFFLNFNVVLIKKKLKIELFEQNEYRKNFSGLIGRTG